MKNKKQIKIIGQNGQISLGKEHAGKNVIVQYLGEGHWIIHTGNFIPSKNALKKGKK